MDGEGTQRQSRQEEATVSRAAPTCEVSATCWVCGFVPCHTAWITQLAEQSAWSERERWVELLDQEEDPL